jgi:hypothetical protein
MTIETPDNARRLFGTRRKRDNKRIDTPEDIEQARQITELVQLHFDGTIDTMEELAEKYTELLDRPVTITKDPHWWNDWDDTYTASYEATFGKKKRVVGFLRFQDAEVVREERLQKKKIQENKERRAQRKLDHARDASYCLTCHQSLPVEKKVTAL